MNTNRYRPTQAAALIVSPDAMGAALLAAAVEYAGGRPMFPAEGEPVRTSLRRLRPSHVLIDCDDPSAADESLIGPAMMMGSRIILFGGEQRILMRKHLALRFHTGVLALPSDLDRLPALLGFGPAAAPAPLA